MKHFFPFLIVKFFAVVLIAFLAGCFIEKSYFFYLAPVVLVITLDFIFKNKLKEVLEISRKALSKIMAEKDQVAIVQHAEDSNSLEKETKLEKFLNNDWNILLRNALDGGANSVLASYVLKKTSELLLQGEGQIDKMITAANGVNQITSELQTIADSIFNISRATKMVAINLSIEAARVGYGGETFRIIAQELQRMALNVDELMKDVDSKITEIAHQTELNHDSCACVGAVFQSINKELDQFKNLMLRIEVLSISQSDQLGEIENKVA